MSKQPTPSPKSASSPLDLSGIDAALGAIVSSGWTDTPQTVHVQNGPATPDPEELAAKGRELLDRAVVPLPVKAEPPPEPARRVREDDQEREPPNKAILDIGLLSDFVTGSRDAQSTAAAAGVTINELHSALATTLSQVDPKELAKAMGLQVAVTQLKAGAVFNALLADLLEDIRAGRAKADVKLELMKILKGIGRLEPRDEKGVAPGGGFSLNINIAGNTPVTIDASN